MNIFRKLFFNYLYLTNPPWDTGVTPPELVSFINTHPPGRALDLGCGTGTNAVYMAKNGWEVSGVDFVRRAVKIARQKARLAGVQVDFHVDDVTRLQNIAGFFDLILDIGCFHNLQENERRIYTQNIDQFLASKGTYLLYTFIKNNPEQKSGITDSDIRSFCQFLRLESRQDGTERGIRSSAWLRFSR